ncbi:polymyxin resistance protein B [Neisseria shayeganii 871]|uniref:Polymyxin resistance protein B n=1 Tax=Neisseria shayeganii 871 TaxID=1032488 RepID=G4CK23_9NEIS|nr:polymyxin resistance protein B [Neisseria shayeganii 871]
MRPPLSPNRLDNTVERLWIRRLSCLPKKENADCRKNRQKISLIISLKAEIYE